MKVWSDQPQKEPVIIFSRMQSSLIYFLLFLSKMTQTHTRMALLESVVSKGWCWNSQMIILILAMLSIHSKAPAKQQFQKQHWFSFAGKAPPAVCSKIYLRTVNIYCSRVRARCSFGRTLQQLSGTTLGDSGGLITLSISFKQGPREGIPVPLPWADPGCGVLL